MSACGKKQPVLCKPSQQQLRLLVGIGCILMKTSACDQKWPVLCESGRKQLKLDISGCILTKMCAED